MYGHKTNVKNKDFGFRDCLQIVGAMMISIWFLITVWDWLYHPSSILFDILRAQLRSFSDLYHRIY